MSEHKQEEYLGAYGYEAGVDIAVSYRYDNEMQHTTARLTIRGEVEEVGDAYEALALASRDAVTKTEAIRNALELTEWEDKSSVDHQSIAVLTQELDIPKQATHITFQVPADGDIHFEHPPHPLG